MAGKLEQGVDVQLQEPKGKRIVARVERWGAWTNVDSNRHSLRLGVNLVPDEPIEIILPEIATDQLDVDGMADLLKQSLAMLLPACTVFVGEAQRDFLSPSEEQESF